MGKKAGPHRPFTRDHKGKKGLPGGGRKNQSFEESEARRKKKKKIRRPPQKIGLKANQKKKKGSVDPKGAKKKKTLRSGGHQRKWGTWGKRQRIYRQYGSLSKREIFKRGGGAYGEVEACLCWIVKNLVQRDEKLPAIPSFVK